MGNRDRYGQHPYGSVHRAARKRFAARMRAGEVFYCWRPGCSTPREPIDPRSWDLGHVDPELRPQFGTRWPEHPRCNRATLTHAKRANGRPAGVVPETGAQIRVPESGPLEIDLAVGTWSTHWFGGFDRRCPECRRLRGPCPEALRNVEREPEPDPLPEADALRLAARREVPVRAVDGERIPPPPEAA